MKKFKSILVLLFLIILTSCNKNTTNINTNESNFEREKKQLIRRIAFQKEIDNTLHFGMVDEPINMNPFYYNDESSKIIVNTLFEPLIRIEESNFSQDIELVLLDKLNISEDGLNYQLKLKENIFWHDGSKLTADDLAFTINYAIEHIDTIYLKSFYIDSEPLTITKIDDYTVDIKLPRKSNSFIYILENLLIVPEHIYSESANIIVDLNSKDYFVGNSSYIYTETTIDEFFNTKELNFISNDKYYGEKPKVENLKYRIVAHYNSTRYDLTDYNIQGGYIPNFDSPAFYNEFFNLSNINDGKVVSILFKMNSKYGSNSQIRDAITNIISPYSLLGIFGNYTNSSIANSIFGQSNQYRILEPFNSADNINKSIEFLKDLQLEDENYTIRFGFILDPGEVQEKVAIYIQELFVSLGLKVELVPLYLDEYYEELGNPKSDKIDFCLYIYDSVKNPDFYKNKFIDDSSLNFSGYSNKTLDEKWDEADSTLDLSERISKYAEIQKIIYNDKPIFPLLYLDTVLATDDRIINIEEATANSSSFFNNLNILDIKEFNYTDEEIKKFDIDLDSIHRVPRFDHVNIKPQQ